MKVFKGIVEVDEAFTRKSAKGLRSLVVRALRWRGDPARAFSGQYAPGLVCATAWGFLPSYLGLRRLIKVTNITPR